MRSAFPSRGASVALAALVLATALQPALATEAAGLDWREHPPLPQPVANNAVAGVERNGAHRLYSFLGLGAGKQHTDITRAAFAWSAGNSSWRTIAPVPGSEGRLAAKAVTVDGSVYVIGGYTVAPDGSEVSTPGVHRLHRHGGGYSRAADMPVPVDDTVGLVYRDRYILLISGWHDHANVDAVQVYDTESNRWTRATSYPGPPVFGHAGGIVGDRLVVCDGVKIVGKGEARKFAASDACFRGEIVADDASEIRWQPLAAHPGPALYRMAATGTRAQGERILFAGGSANPYNYNGIGYDGEPSTPSDRIFSFDLGANEWRTHGRAPVATMDHRALVELGDRFYLIGGMLAGQKVTDRVFSFRLPSASD